MVSQTADGLLFAKNSDRDPGESQLLERVPASVHPHGATVQCTWIRIPQVPRTNTVLLSRPWWMWGAEMGTNEHGVTIGNEAVFTRAPKESDDGLLGMDLLRLALERADTAVGALDVIVELLERYGQGGACSWTHPRFRYDSSFLIADPNGAFVLETSGRRFAVEEVRGAARAISNGLSIPRFAEAHADRLRTRVAACAARHTLTRHGSRLARTPGDLMAVLRSHGPHPGPSYSIWNGAMAAPCMHAGGGVLANSQTTASWVADLRAPNLLHWVTATAAPCTSLFKPVRVDEWFDPGRIPTERFDPDSRWWRHERLHRAVMADPGALLARYCAERDRVERDWRSDPPSAAAAFARADALEESWLDDVRAAEVTDRRPWWVRRSWDGWDREAAMPPLAARPASTPRRSAA